MKKFLINIALFIGILLIIGELVARGSHVMADIPQRIIDKDGIQKYIPNQKGYWQGGDHHWEINALGWPGKIPDTFDELYVIIGDSFIENFLNPIECHQAEYLKQLMPENNFFEASRSGITLIESLEISKQTDTLSPIKTIIHTGLGDIIESIEDIKKKNDITQYNIANNKVRKGELKSPKLKKILYSIKVVYYLYDRIAKIQRQNKKNDKENNQNSKDKFDQNKEKIKSFITYIKNSYEIENKIFVFKPRNKKISEFFKENGLSVIQLDNSTGKSWSFSHDPHWTCYGHSQVAKQIKQVLEN